VTWVLQGLCHIIEIAISLSGNTKDDMMNHFMKCCASLFAEVLYVDDSAAIAPIEITNDTEDSYITDKVNLPMNFTVDYDQQGKLGVQQERKRKE
jgi:hypothetical protein